MEQLELFTTQQLMDELCERTSWVGVIIHSTKEAKPPACSKHNEFTVRFNANNFNPENLRLLLEEIHSKIPEFGGP